MALLKFHTFTRQFVDEKGKKIEGSIAQISYLYLGRCKQRIILRGKNINNPILVFLHGGPGVMVHGLFRYYNSDLENHFLVVGWDQRGTGKSYHSKIDPKSMTIDQFISDLHELIDFLKKRFGHEKVYIFGESWGSLLGILYAKKFPQDLIAYIGSGQISDMKRSEKLSFDFTLDEARRGNNKKAIKELQAILDPGKHVQDFKIKVKWLVKFGGYAFGKSTILHYLSKLLSVDEYALPDILRLILGNKMSLKYLWPQIYETNFFLQAPKLEVPVFFLLGRHDRNVPSALGAEYFEFLKAPFKKLIWFENSGHNPQFEESLRFNQEMVSIKNAIL